MNIKIIQMNKRFEKKRDVSTSKIDDDDDGGDDVLDSRLLDHAMFAQLFALFFGLFVRLLSVTVVIMAMAR